MKRLYLMITITNRVVGSGRFVDFYRAVGAPGVFTALGRGTASDDVLSYLGLEATEKHRRQVRHELPDLRRPLQGPGNRH